MALSLVERPGELTDPRDRRGRQYPMVGLLTLCLVGILAGRTTLAAFAQFGRLRRRRLGHALGFKDGNTPCADMLALLLRGLGADHLDRIIGAWLAHRHAGGWEHPALDGNRLCGSRDGDMPGTHLLAAYAPHTLGGADDLVLVVDDDQGISGAAVENRPGFQRLLAEVSLGHVGVVFGREVSRLSRSCRDWHQLLEVCALFQVLIADADGVYDPTDPSDRLLLGLRRMMSEAEPARA